MYTDGPNLSGGRVTYATNARTRGCREPNAELRVRVALHVARFRGRPRVPQTMHHPSAHKHTHGTIQHQPALWLDRPLPPVAESHGLQGPYRASLFVLLPPLYGFESVKPSGTHTGLWSFFSFSHSSCFLLVWYPTVSVFLEIRYVLESFVHALSVLPKVLYIWISAVVRELSRHAPSLLRKYPICIPGGPLRTEGRDRTNSTVSAARFRRAHCSVSCNSVEYALLLFANCTTL